MYRSKSTHRKYLYPQPKTCFEALRSLFRSVAWEGFARAGECEVRGVRSVEEISDADVWSRRGAGSWSRCGVVVMAVAAGGSAVWSLEARQCTVTGKSALNLIV